MVEDKRPTVEEFAKKNHLIEYMKDFGPEEKTSTTHGQIDFFENKANQVQVTANEERTIVTVVSKQPLTVEQLQLISNTVKEFEK